MSTESWVQNIDDRVLSTDFDSWSHFPSSPLVPCAPVPRAPWFSLGLRHPLWRAPFLFRQGVPNISSRPLRASDGFDSQPPSVSAGFSPGWRGSSRAGFSPGGTTSGTTQAMAIVTRLPGWSRSRFRLECQARVSHVRSRILVLPGYGSAVPLCRIPHVRSRILVFPGPGSHVCKDKIRMRPGLRVQPGYGSAMSPFDALTHVFTYISGQLLLPYHTSAIIPAPLKKTRVRVHIPSVIPPPAPTVITTRMMDPLMMTLTMTPMAPVGPRHLGERLWRTCPWVAPTPVMRPG